MKKILRLSKSLLVAAALLVGGSSAWADETALDPVGVFTWTNAPAITYDGTATSWAINQGGITGGKIGKYAGPYAIVKFDASTILAGKVLLTATLSFDITAGAYNSSMNIAQLADASFDPATVTTETFDATATQFQAGDWSTKNATTPFSYDVTDKVSANNILAFAIYTNTGREQTLKNVKLTLEYSTGAVAKYNYSLKAVNGSGTEIKTLASGEEFEGKTATVYFPAMFYEEGTLYTTTENPYSVTFDKENKTKSIIYSKASSSIVAYMEGEDVNANSGENSAYSNGKNGYVAGGKTQTLATLTPGKYMATIYLVGNGNRSVVIRNTANTDVNTNTISSLPISKTSAAGTYNSEEFAITENTTVGFSGYTSGTKTNQSADIDYIYITRTGDVELPSKVSVTIPASGFATLASTYALDCENLPSGVKAYIVSEISVSAIKLEEVTSTVTGNTGLILEGAAGTYNIAVSTSGSAVSGNKLKAAVKATEVAANAAFVLKDGKFCLVTAASSVPAGKAYLLASDVPATARELNIEEGTTGINSVQDSRFMVNDYYDLQGRRVAQPTKGLYIQNGRKVLVK